jgi:phage major head subunit gpT-like protein
MATSVSAFTALARAEFMAGKLAADDKAFPAAYDSFTSVVPSTVRVEVHTYMSNLPRLYEFKGTSHITRLVSKPYSIENIEYRIGPVTVRKTDLDDDQTGGYLRTINEIPTRGQRDIGHKILTHLASGQTNKCFDGTAFFANSHTVGAGDNLTTFNPASNDGVTHRVIALITDNAAIKPVIFQDRQSLSELMTDADSPQAALQKEYMYWADCRFGLAYGFWWDAIDVAISDTPTVPECYDIIRQTIDTFRTFTLPKGADADDPLYVHEGWVPNRSNFKLLCNLSLAELLRTAVSITQYQASGGNVDNVYKDVAEVIPTSALGA